MRISIPQLLTFVSIFASTSTFSFGQVLDLETFQQTGAREATLSVASESGASIEYLDNSASGRDDTGMVAAIQSGSLTPFTQIGDTLTYSFTISVITATNNQFTPLYRVGFDFGDTAALRYETSTGTAPRFGFGSNTNGNPFSQGTVHSMDEDWAPFDLREIRFDDGNEIEATVSLELVGMSDDLYDYQMTVTYVSKENPTHTNTKTYTFTGVNGNEVVSLFHVTNSAGMVEGDAWAISNASAEFTGTNTTWANYPVTEDSIVDTGDWMGFLNVANDPWAYSFSLDQWLYIRQSSVTENGSWVYVLNY